MGIDGIAHVPTQPAWYEKKCFRGSKKVFLIGKRKSFKHMLNNQPNMCEKTVEGIKNRFNRPQKVLLTAKLEHHHGLPKIVNFFKVSGQQGLENSEKTGENSETLPLPSGRAARPPPGFNSGPSYEPPMKSSYQYLKDHPTDQFSGW